MYLVPVIGTVFLLFLESIGFGSFPWLSILLGGLLVNLLFVVIARVVHQYRMDHDSDYRLAYKLSRYKL